MEHIELTIKKRFEVRSSRPCEFCKELDPQFPHRHPMDQVVSFNRKSTASAHLSEDGYIRHRIVELTQLESRTSRNVA